MSARNMCPICRGTHDDYRSAIACEASGAPTQKEYTYRVGSRLTIRHDCGQLTVTVERLTIMHYSHEAGYAVRDSMGTRHVFSDEYLRTHKDTTPAYVKAVALE